MGSGRWGSLADRRFRWLLIGQTCSSFAVFALYLGLSVWVKAMTGSSALAGCVLLAVGVPTLFAPLVGHLADRVRRKPLMITTNAVLGTSLLSLLAVHSRDQIWLIYLVGAIAGCATDVIGATRNGLLRDMLSDDQLPSANAALQTLGQGSQLVSPLFGAGLYTLLGGGRFALIDAGIFAVAILALCMVRVTESAPEPKSATPFRTEVLAGFRHIRSVPMLFQLAMVSAGAFAVVGLFEAVGFAVVDRGLHQPPSFNGVLTSVQGAGSLVGALISVRILRRLGEPRTVGTALLMVALGALGMAVRSLPVAMAGSVILGLGIPVFLVGWSTALQRLTAPRLQGRVNATAGMLVTTPQTVSIATGAALISVVDYRILLLVIALGMTAAGLILLIRPAGETPSGGDDAGDDERQTRQTSRHSGRESERPVAEAPIRLATRRAE